MSLIAELTVPAEEFCVGRGLSSADVRAGFRAFVSTGSRHPPYLWVDVEAGEAAGVAEALVDVDGIERVRTLANGDSQTLFGLEWADDPGGLFGVVRETDVAIAHAVGAPDRWEVHVFCEDRDDLSAFRTRCEAAGISVDLARLRQDALDGGESASSLSDAQFEALRLARDRGYFEVPRQATLEELGEDLGISRQAVSNRLRRGTEKLVAAAIQGH